MLKRSHASRMCHSSSVGLKSNNPSLIKELKVKEWISPEAQSLALKLLAHKIKLREYIKCFFLLQGPPIYPEVILKEYTRSFRGRLSNKGKL